MADDPVAKAPDWLPREQRQQRTTEEELGLLRYQLLACANKLDALVTWQAQAEPLLALREEVSDMVAGLKWLRTTGQVIAWLSGAVLGVLVFVKQVLPWLQVRG
ncbi:MAG: hypothetical protein RL375_492 [Pseudomonadota bacterium]|jgi:hypothetical protein